MYTRLAALAAAAALWTQPMAAEPYTLFIYEDPGQIALRSLADGAGADYWSEYEAYGAELAAAGVLRSGSALTTGDAVAVVGAGPRADGVVGASLRSGLPLGGYFQIDVASDGDAIAWARKVPAAGLGMVEVRAGYPVPGMSM